MRGNIEIHLRHLVYSLSGAFAGCTVKFWINQFIFPAEYDTTGITDVIMYAFFLAGIMTGIFLDDYIITHRYQINYKKFLLYERIILTGFNLLTVALCVFCWKFI